MKTFIELLESKSVPRRVFSHYYRKDREVPEEKKTYPAFVKKEIMNRLKPLIESLELEVHDISPGWNVYIYLDPKENKELAIFAPLRLEVGEWSFRNVSSKKEIVGSFISESDANEALKEFKNACKFMLRVNHYFEIRKNDGHAYIFLTDLKRIAATKNIDFDFGEIDDFCAQWFYEEGPQWDKFKQEHRGHFAAKNFGQ